MTTKKTFSFSPFQQLMIIILLAVGLNVNTLFNDYTLDDGLIMTANTLVEQGIKAIPEILTTDLFHGFKDTPSALSEARYRPFTLVVNAIEHQFFGANPFVSHLINILLFALICALLFKLLHNYIFKQQHYLFAFITCLLFAVHPIHTEVIANVKSRDELITFLLIIVTLLYAIKYNLRPKLHYAIVGLICFFLAILTRESAITFIAIVPLVLYFFFDKTIKQSILYALPLALVTIVYLYIRHTIIGGIHSTTQLDVLNSPYLYATASEAFSTKVYILLKYVVLLFVPHPLSFDYGYNQIPYITPVSVQFILAVIVWLGLIAFAIITFKRKSLFSFCILYFIITISLVSNFLVDVGTPLSERFLFQPSLAFCLALAALYIQFRNRFAMYANVILGIVVILFSVKTIHRNSVWKNNVTLDLTDVVSSPNSFRANLYALEICILKGNENTNPEEKKANLKLAVKYGEQSNRIFSESPRAHSDLLIAYHNLFECYSSTDLFLKENNLDPTNTDAINFMKTLSEDFYKQGNGFAEQNNPAGAVQAYLKCLQLNNKHVEAWYNLGGNYYLLKDSVKASNAWDSVKKLSPEHLFNKDDFYAN